MIQRVAAIRSKAKIGLVVGRQIGMRINPGIQDRHIYIDRCIAVSHRKHVRANAGDAGWNRLVADVGNAVRLDGQHAFVPPQFLDDAWRQRRGKAIQGVTVAVPGRDAMFPQQRVHIHAVLAGDDVHGEIGGDDARRSREPAPGRGQQKENQGGAEP